MYAVHLQVGHRYNWELKEDLFGSNFQTFEVSNNGNNGAFLAPPGPAGRDEFENRLT
jgi:hypothetical protein